MKKRIKKNHGGKRKGSGRKPIPDKKIPVIVYPRRSEIDSCGGDVRAKEIALNAIVEAAKASMK